MPSGSARAKIYASCGSGSDSTTLQSGSGSSLHFNAELDPAPHQNDQNLRPLVYRPFKLYFEPLKLLNFNFNAYPVPVPALHSNADPDPDAKN
jgi:hypothetical protein